VGDEIIFSTALNPMGPIRTTILEITKGGEADGTASIKLKHDRFSYLFKNGFNFEINAKWVNGRYETMSNYYADGTQRLGRPFGSYTISFTIPVGFVEVISNTCFAVFLFTV
jgi:hypothetical protein